MHGLCCHPQLPLVAVCGAAPGYSVVSLTVGSSHGLRLFGLSSHVELQHQASNSEVRQARYRTEGSLDIRSLHLVKIFEKLVPHMCARQVKCHLRGVASTTVDDIDPALPIVRNIP